MSQQLKAQLAIRYAKHLPSRKQGTTEDSGGTANESDDVVIMTSSANLERLRVYNASASDDDNLNGGGDSTGPMLVPVLHWRLWAAEIKKHVVFDWLEVLHYDCDGLVARIIAAVIH